MDSPVSIELTLERVLEFFNRADDVMRGDYSDISHELNQCYSPEFEAEQTYQNS